ncbi:MAG: response regulator transcription factor [Chloroflexi bacterium]|nr:response regulator transcription factor [Chloroflexota bacterium]
MAALIAEQGYRTHTVSSMRDAVSAVVNSQADAVLLDLASGQVMLDLADTLMGLPFCPPVVVLDSEPDLKRVIAALRIGVSDYLFVSDGDQELVSRLIMHIEKGRAAAEAARQREEGGVLRPSANGARSATGLELNAARRVLLVEDVPILLSAIELSLVETLIQHASQLVTYDELMQAAFPAVTDKEHALRLLRPHIARLRRKFESVPNARWRIANFRSQGYILQRVGVPISKPAAAPETKPAEASPVAESEAS